MYLRLTSTPYAAKDDFELLASNLPVVGCMHPLAGCIQFWELYPEPHAH